MSFEPKQITDVLGSEEVQGVLTDINQIARETRNVIDTIFGTTQTEPVTLEKASAQEQTTSVEPSPTSLSGTGQLILVGVGLLVLLAVVR